MSNPEARDKARLKRQRNLTAKYNKNKPKPHKPKALYSRSESKRILLSDN